MMLLVATSLDFLETFTPFWIDHQKPSLKSVLDILSANKKVTQNFQKSYFSENAYLKNEQEYHTFHLINRFYSKVCLLNTNHYF